MPYIKPTLYDHKSAHALHHQEAYERQKIIELGETLRTGLILQMSYYLQWSMNSKTPALPLSAKPLDLWLKEETNRAMHAFRERLRSRI